MKKLILGLGNMLNRDEGLGIHALEPLRKELESREDLEIRDGGTLGLSLLSLVEECGHLLILDTINADKKAGDIIELTENGIPLFKKIKMSDHQTTFQEVLGFAKIRGKLPQNLFLLGIQPEDTSLGIGLSDTVKRAMPGLIARTKEIIKQWP